MTPNAWEINSEKGLAARCQKICLLGEGGFGTVHEVVYDDAKTYALKTTLHSSETRKDCALLEGFYAQRLSHENLVQVHAVENSLTGGKTHILMENCLGGDLRSVLDQHVANGTRLPLDRAWNYLVQAAKALLYLHHPETREDKMDGIFGHADIKPENMLLADAEQTELKIGDFGLMTKYGPGMKNYSQGGTPAYMAPEVSKQGPSDWRADCYSLGVVAFELLNGYHPFNGESEDELRQRHTEGWEEAVPDYGRDWNFALLVESLMCADPDERLTMRDLFRQPAFRERAFRYEVKSRDRKATKLRRELACQEEQNEQQLRVIEAQAAIIRNLKRLLAQNAANDTHRVPPRPKTPSPSQELGILTPPPSPPDVLLVLPDNARDEADTPSITEPPTAVIAPPSPRSWSSTSSQEFRLTCSRDGSANSSCKCPLSSRASSRSCYDHRAAVGPVRIFNKHLTAESSDSPAKPHSWRANSRQDRTCNLDGQHFERSLRDIPHMELGTFDVPDISARAAPFCHSNMKPSTLDLFRAVRDIDSGVTML